MPAKDSDDILDSAVPKSPQTDRLRDGEKKALELSERAEHADGPEREHLQEQAEKAAEPRKH
jgi:hypothetical protein